MKDLAKRRRMNRDDAEARRDLLERASNFLRQAGYAGTTIRALADYLQLVPSNIYYHFPNKETLVVACLDQQMEKLIGQAESVARAAVSPTERAQKFLGQHIDFQIDWLRVMGNGKVAAQGLTMILEDLPPEAKQGLAAKQTLYLDLLRSILRDGASCGEFRFADVTVAAFALLSLGEHLIHWYRSEGRLGAETIRGQLVDMGMRMVLAPRSL